MVPFSHLVDYGCLFTTALGDLCFAHFDIAAANLFTFCGKSCSTITLCRQVSIYDVMLVVS